MIQLVVALGTDRELVSRALAEMRGAGLRDAWVVMDESSGDPGVEFEGLKRVAHPHQGHIARGALQGGTLGGVVAAATIAIPAVGPFVFALTAPVATAAGAVAGAIAGGLEQEDEPEHASVEDMLRKFGWPEMEIARYARGVEAGRMLVVARATSHADAEKIEHLYETAGLENTAIFCVRED